MQLILTPRSKTAIAFTLAENHLNLCKLSYDLFAADAAGHAMTEILSQLQELIEVGNQHLPMWQAMRQEPLFDPDEAEDPTNEAIGFIYHAQATHGRLPIRELAPGLFPETHEAQAVVNGAPGPEAFRGDWDK